MARVLLAPSNRRHARRCQLVVKTDLDQLVVNAFFDFQGEIGDVDPGGIVA